MATTGYRFPTSDAAVSGSWTNPTNVQADDTSYALCDISAKNTTAERQQGNFGFSTAVLPEAGTIIQVNLQVVWKLTTNASVIANLGTRAGVSAGYGALHEDSTEPIADVTRTYDITSERSWVPANMRDGTFTTRLQGRNGNDASNPGYLFDYVAVEVVYTTLQTFPQTIAATAVGTATVARRATYKRTLAVVAVVPATVTTKLVFKQALAATALGVATLTAKLVLKVTLAATALGTATLTLRKTFKRTLAAIALGVTTLARTLSFKRALAATAVGVATLTPVESGGEAETTLILCRLLSERARLFESDLASARAKLATGGGLNE